MKNNILITICARKNSKGIKNKNLIKLNGKPLISHTIEMAIKWKKSSNIVVSSDSDKILKIAKKYKNVDTVLRPKYLATDKISKIPSISHALKNYEKLKKQSFDIIVDLDPTSPLRSIEDLNLSLKEFNKKNIDYLLSVSESRKNPYFNMLEKVNSKFQLCKNSRKKILRRQDAPKVYDVNASIYIYARKWILKRKNYFNFNNDNVGIYIMRKKLTIDIDNSIDFKLVEFLFKIQ